MFVYFVVGSLQMVKYTFGNSIIPKFVQAECVYCPFKGIQICRNYFVVGSLQMVNDKKKTSEHG
jgi:hypothetical protein